MATPNNLAARRFLLSNGEGVVYTPTPDEPQVNLIGKKINWITEYYVMDKAIPRIVRELDDEESQDPPAGPTEDQPKALYELRGSTRTGFHVLADEGKPPPTREQRDPFDVDLTTCRQFVLENGERVLWTGSTIWLKRAHEHSDVIGKVVHFKSSHGTVRTTSHILRELEGSEKSTILSMDGPTEDEPTIPYIIWGTPANSSGFYVQPSISRDALAEAEAKRAAARNAEYERHYVAISKDPDISNCREYLLQNGQRVIYVPRTAGIASTHKDKDFEGLNIVWNLTSSNVSERSTFIVREVEADEKSTNVSPNGPSDDMPTAPRILTGTINGGLYALPPRCEVAPPAPSVPDVSPTSPLGHADSGRLFPVVSTTGISAEFKDRLLQANMEDCGGSTSSFLVLVESLSEKYEDESNPGDSITNTSSPFQNQGPQECALLLRKLRRETGADVNFEYFVMLDARSLTDDTVLMVEAIRADDYDSDGGAAAEEEGEPHALRVLTLRAQMELVNGRFLFYDVEGDMREDIERLEEEESTDGVLRE